MPKFDGRDPHGPDALAEKVNDIFRGIALSPEEIFPTPAQGARLLPDPSPDAVRAFADLSRWARDWRPGDPMFGAALSCTEASEVLLLALGTAVQHQLREHRDESWVGCDHVTEVVYYAAKVFAATVEGTFS